MKFKKQRIRLNPDKYYEKPYIRVQSEEENLCHPNFSKNYFELPLQLDKTFRV